MGHRGSLHSGPSSFTGTREFRNQVWQQPFKMLNHICTGLLYIFERHGNSRVLQNEITNFKTNFQITGINCPNQFGLIHAATIHFSISTTRSQANPWNFANKVSSMTGFSYYRDRRPIYAHETNWNLTKLYAMNVRHNVKLLCRYWRDRINYNLNLEWR